MLEKIISAINDVFYSYALIILLILGGIIFTVRTGFSQFRLFGEQLKCVKEKPGKDGVSSFQALMVSTASRVGTGNIIGVSSAICLGGFGSVFWMWVIALLGGATALIESTLAQIYKRRDKDGGYYGGPAYYIEDGLKKRRLAVTFSILLIITYGVGFNMLASYNLQSTFEGYSFYKSTSTPLIIGFIVAAVVCFCLFGGGKRLLKTTQFLVPVMGVAYILVAISMVMLNAKELPGIFKTIFKEAFDLKAIFGGFSGSAVMYGIKRGLFSNEAGVGSAPNASASADVNHPVKQGLVQVLSVFIDTILVCSATAFMCMSSGVANTKSMEGAPYVQESLRATLGDFGPVFITVAMILFAFTTLIGNLFYVDKCFDHILGYEPSKKFKRIYYIVASLIIFLGAIAKILVGDSGSNILWGIADITMGCMTIINVPVILHLSKYAIAAIKDYDKQRKKGKNPVFKAKNINLPHDVDCWK